MVYAEYFWKKKNVLPTRRPCLQAIRNNNKPIRKIFIFHFQVNAIVAKVPGKPPWKMISSIAARPLSDIVAKLEMRQLEPVNWPPKPIWLIVH
jgi:hypothetical protein